MLVFGSCLASGDDARSTSARSNDAQILWVNVSRTALVHSSLPMQQARRSSKPLRVGLSGITADLELDAQWNLEKIAPDGMFIKLARLQAFSREDFIQLVRSKEPEELGDLIQSGSSHSYCMKQHERR